MFYINLHTHTSAILVVILDYFLIVSVGKWFVFLFVRTHISYIESKLTGAIYIVSILVFVCII